MRNPAGFPKWLFYVSATEWGCGAGMGAKNAEPPFENQADSTSSKFLGWHFVLKNQDSFSIYYSKAVLLYVIEIHLIN